MKAYPDLPFLLIGDAGQEDSSIHTTAPEEFGDQVIGIIIRDIDPKVASHYDETVKPSIRRAEAIGTPMRLVKDSVQAANLASKLELIDD